MKTTILEIGNEAGIILPASVLKMLHLSVGDSVEISIQDGKVSFQPCNVKTKYTLSELIAQCDREALFPNELQDWEGAPPVGSEAK